MSRPRPARQARIELPVTRESLTAALTRRLRAAGAVRGTARPTFSRSACPPAAGAQLGAMLRPIATPLVMSGFEPDVADVIGGGFRDAGFSAGDHRRHRRAAAKPRPARCARATRSACR